VDCILVCGMLAYCMVVYYSLVYCNI